MDNDGHTVIMRDWYASGRVGEHSITLGDYGADMGTYRIWGETVHHWSGEDREGNPLHVAWLPEPKFGSAAYCVYEIQPAPADPGPEVRLVSLRGCSRFTLGMTAGAAFENIGRASAEGAAVQMRKIQDRAGRDLLVVHTQTDDVRCVYAFRTV
jgi:hypothetical protein